MVIEDKSSTVLSIIEEHRSIRKYKEWKMPEEHFKKILRAGLRAPSSANLQSYCIIRIIDYEKKRQISKLAGDQDHIMEASEFLVFIADVRRLIKASEMLGLKPTKPNLATFYIAAIDAAIAAQNIVITAEALGYGTCYIGGIQNNPCKIAEILELPNGTYPLFGLCIGMPAEIPEKRIRLPQDIMVFQDIYPQDDMNVYKAIKYYETSGNLQSYIRRLKRYLGVRGRLEKRGKDMLLCLKSQGFDIS